MSSLKTNPERCWAFIVCVVIWLSLPGCSYKPQKFSFVNKTKQEIFIDSIEPLSPNIACGLLGKGGASSTVPPEKVPEQITLKWFKVNHGVVDRANLITSQVSIVNFSEASDHKHLEIAYVREEEWEVRFMQPLVK